LAPSSATAVTGLLQEVSGVSEKPRTISRNQRRMSIGRLPPAQACTITGNFERGVKHRRVGRFPCRALVWNVLFGLAVNSPLLSQASLMARLFFVDVASRPAEKAKSAVGLRQTRLVLNLRSHPAFHLVFDSLGYVLGCWMYQWQQQCAARYSRRYDRSQVRQAAEAGDTQTLSRLPFHCPFSFSLQFADFTLRSDLCQNLAIFIL
jgi:hypothetical protein